LVFVLYPFITSFYFSFTNWDGASKTKTFIGLANYGKLFQDPIFWLALKHNLIWMVTMAIIPIGLGLILAVLLWSRPPGFTLFRTIFFMPQVLGAAVIGIIWKWIYVPDVGVFGSIAKFTGLKFIGHAWLGDTSTSLGAILVANIWAGIGFFFIIMLAALQGVDKDLMDAATVDGANAFARFRFVVIPQLSNVITMVTVLALIGGLNVFDIVWSMTQGGPANSSDLIGTYSYLQAFRVSKVGYAASLTVVMTILALFITIIFIRLRERGEA
jgi:multiple sugar transport system permease protein/raffinose/stachyose/melibiose transport system permease protein